MITREKGEQKAMDASDTVIYKIEVPANRYIHVAILFTMYAIVRCGYFI